MGATTATLIFIIASHFLACPEATYIKADKFLGNTYTIVNKNSGKAIDIPDQGHLGPKAPSVGVQQYEEHGGPNQQFTFRQYRDDNYLFYIENKLTDSVLEVPGGLDAPYQAIQIRTNKIHTDPAWRSQRWQLYEWEDIILSNYEW